MAAHLSVNLQLLNSKSFLRFTWCGNVKAAVQLIKAKVFQSRAIWQRREVDLELSVKLAASAMKHFSCFTTDHKSNSPDFAKKQELLYALCLYRLVKYTMAHKANHWCLSIEDLRSTQRSTIFIYLRKMEQCCHFSYFIARL